MSGSALLYTVRRASINKALSTLKTLRFTTRSYRSARRIDSEEPPDAGRRTIRGLSRLKAVGTGIGLWAPGRLP